MPRLTHRPPAYRLHKASGQARVVLNGRTFYLGPYGSQASKVEYDRLIGEWLANGRRLGGTLQGAPDDLSVNELMAAYLEFAQGYYRKNGKPTSELEGIKQSMRVLRRLYGSTPARDFSPLGLKAVREQMIKADVCRKEINKRVGRVVRMFRWAVENEMVPPSVHHGLRAVAGLKQGRSEARESEPVKPVPDTFVDAIEPHVSRQVWAMVQLQRLTGMRPGEVCQMRTADLDTAGQVWTYKPGSHKTEHHGRERTIFLGPRAQAVLKPWLRTDLAAWLFSPREAMEAKWAERKRNRKTPMTPSHRARKRKTRPKRAPQDRYETHAYYYAIRRACELAGVPPWHPNQLRHNAATWLRREYGLDVARAILGHASPVVTEVYAEVDREKARGIMGEVG